MLYPSQAQNELRRIQIEAQQNEAQAIGEQKANIVRAEGIKQSNVLQGEGEAQAITVIDKQLRNNPTYLEWLKSTRWDGKLPLVTGGGGSGSHSFCTSRSESVGDTQTSIGNITTSSSDFPSSTMNRFNSMTRQH